MKGKFILATIAAVACIGLLSAASFRVDGEKVDIFKRITLTGDLTDKTNTVTVAQLYQAIINYAALTLDDVCEVGSTTDRLITAGGLYTPTGLYATTSAGIGIYDDAGNLGMFFPDGGGRAKIIGATNPGISFENTTSNEEYWFYVDSNGDLALYNGVTLWMLDDTGQNLFGKAAEGLSTDPLASLHTRFLDGNNDVKDMVLLERDTSDTPTAGIGAGFTWWLEDLGGGEKQASIDVVLDDVTDGQEDATMIFYLNQNGTITEVGRMVGADGSWRVLGEIQDIAGANGITVAQLYQAVANYTLHDYTNIDSTPGSDLSGSGKISILTAGINALSVANLCYMNASGTLYQSDADEAASMPGVVLAYAAISGDATGQVLHEGYYRNDTWSWTPGLLYASTTNGAMTQTAPSGSKDQVQMVGYAKSATIIYFDPNLTLVEVP